MGASEVNCKTDSESTQGPTREGWLPFRIIRPLEYLPCPPCAMRDDEARSSPPLASLWRPCADIASGVDSEQTHRQPQRPHSVPISPAELAELCSHDLQCGRDDRIST